MMVRARSSDLIMNPHRISVMMLFFLSSVHISSPSQFPSPLMIKEWVDQLQQELVSLADSASAGNHLRQIFMDNQNYFTVETNNAAQLVETAARNIENFLKKRATALETLATAAENFQMEHQWKDEFQEDDIVYFNAKDDLQANETEGRKNRIRPEFKEDPSFKNRLTSYNHTAVHIPTDIYDGSTILLNELNWTEALEDVFKKNREDDPTLLWQVFGSATGLARYYPVMAEGDLKRHAKASERGESIEPIHSGAKSPALEGQTRGGVHWTGDGIWAGLLLTPGFRHHCKKVLCLWAMEESGDSELSRYVQGAASPKDMLILVDASGSVSGLTLKLIQTSVSEMLETLSDDDYVNVVHFNTKVNNTACFDHLVQANVRNKKILKDAVQNISAKGITNYTKGFEFAFEQLSNPDNSRANCNKIIMLFTDGGEERAEEIFNRYNIDKKVRVFTFSVGQHNYDTWPIKWMACANKGYFYEIPSIGAIRINTQEYLDVLGRPMVLADAKQVQWTNVYLDALELGLVITGTLPVFNKTKDGGSQNQHQNQLILGVMGVDVSLDDIKRLTPRFTIGPNGYYFAIDPNGYVLLHPNLQPKNPKFQEPVTLDFLDAELENDIKVQIRTLMIDRDPGEKTIETLVKSQDERYIDRGIRTYTWAPVNGTDYSLALVLPECGLHYIEANLGNTIKQAMFFDTIQPEKFEEYGYTFIAPREYCKDLKVSSNNTQFLMDFNEYIDRKTPNDPMCNVTLVNRLLLDAGLTADLVKTWKEQIVDGVSARFVATDGGITRVYPKSAGEEWCENSETYDSSFYKRSLDNDIYIFTAPYVNKSRESGYESGILVSKAVDLEINGAKLKPAVVGVKLNVSAWMNSFINATTKKNCKDEICGCLRNDKQVDCVILDDGGFLLMSNQDEYITQIGQFFGEVDPVLMITLVNTSLFSFNKTYDYQSVCDPERETKAAAGLRSICVPTIADMITVGWWASTAIWSILQQLLLSLTLPNIMGTAYSEDDLSDAFSKESCITEQTQYFFENDNRSFSGAMDCGNCSRMYRAEKLPNTNLVFLISDAKSSCLSCDPKPLRQAEQPSNGPDPCVLAQNPRYRKGPDVCFDNNADEDASDCGGGCCLSPSLWPLLSLQLLLLWLFTGTKTCLS
ncbi:voltage-dependent calcium channel subunit alpha-2/delta-1-like [Myxocyprinus asiaticus]|uniref:voltage-dependent calcium channel subunit alpha-2/delta-1-like n=1 Tax=Myxocyprinus asiaticus TaxID=70543 RepID=UPI0022235690|nr:voltage-dependent calcium channel subunit alpha-2/delta-1-like [Myxocyprinus asiaticus]